MMWDWVTWAMPGLFVMGTALVAYQIGHGQGWAEGFECGCLEADSRHKNAITKEEIG